MVATRKVGAADRDGEQHVTRPAAIRLGLVVTGGENIHPAEIENLAAEQPEVVDCAVVGLPDARWGEVPVLAVVVRPGAELDRQALQRLFDARLARFKHPREVVVVDVLPKTALGKVQRAALARGLIQRNGPPA